MKQICNLVVLLCVISAGAHDSTRTSVNAHLYKSNPYIFMDALKDRAGNLWFATSGQGVYRYDGRSFTNFTMKQGLNDSNVSCIYEDKAGMLWFGTNKGLCRYDGKGFTEVALPLPDSSGMHARKYEVLCQTPATVNSILQDKAGSFWFVTGTHGIYRYTPGRDSSNTLSTHGGTWTNFLAGSIFQCIAEDKTGNILVGSWEGNGVFCYDGKKFDHMPGFSDGMIFSMMQDRSGNVWVGTRDFGADRYDGKVVTHFSNKEGLMNGNVTCMFEDTKGNIWFGSDFSKHSLKRGDAVYYNGKEFTNVTERAAILKFTDYNVRSIVEDTAGNIWFGSRNGLLIRYDGVSFTDVSEQLPKE